jgi:hypothetical protein
MIDRMLNETTKYQSLELIIASINDQTIYNHHRASTLDRGRGMDIS